VQIKKKLDSIKIQFFFYERTILSDVLTNTKAAEIGITTIRTASITLLKNAPKEGVIA